MIARRQLLQMLARDSHLLEVALEIQRGQKPHGFHSPLPSKLVVPMPSKLDIMRNMSDNRRMSFRPFWMVLILSSRQRILELLKILETRKCNFHRHGSKLEQCKTPGFEVPQLLSKRVVMARTS